MILNIESMAYSSTHIARTIWEALFREVRAERFKSLTSFVSDLHFFEELIREEQNRFWWTFNLLGATRISLANPYYESEPKSNPIPGFGNCYRVEVYPNKIEITKEEEEDGLDFTKNVHD